MLEARLPLLQTVGAAETDVLTLAEPLTVRNDADAEAETKGVALSVWVSVILPDWSADIEDIEDWERLDVADGESTADCDSESLSELKFDIDGVGVGEPGAVCDSVTEGVCVNSPDSDTEFDSRDETDGDTLKRLLRVSLAVCEVESVPLWALADAVLDTVCVPVAE